MLSGVEQLSHGTGCMRLNSGCRAKVLKQSLFYR